MGECRDIIQLDGAAHEQSMQRYEEWQDSVRAQLGNTALAETVETPDWVKHEEYSHSMKLLGEVGRHKANGTLDTPEGRNAEALLRECFDSSVIEMLHTDREFREKLEINRERKHIVHGGKVLAQDGKTWMVELCQNGAESAALEALASPQMEAVAIRCAADARNAVLVEQMPIGSVRMAVSMYPKEAMAQYGTKFYDDLGFREGLAFIQWYYRLDEGTLLAGSYAVDHADPDVMRQVLKQFGGKIPEGESTNTWLDHAMQFACSLEEARERVLTIREEYYKRKGLDHVVRFSVDEFMAINKPATDELFATYLELSVAHHTKKRNALITELVAGLLQRADNLRDEIVTQLQQINQKQELNRDDTALIEQLIRYATAERLRGGLALLGHTERPAVQVLGIPMGQAFMQHMAATMTHHIQDGVKNNRTYGGCTRSMNLSKEGGDGTGSSTDLDPLEAYGGRGAEAPDGEKGDYTACTYQHTGCYCCPYDGSGKPLAEPMTVTAKKRPGFVSCLRPGCGAFMVLDAKGNPKKVEKGAIFKSAEALAAKTARSNDEQEPGEVRPETDSLPPHEQSQTSGQDEHAVVRGALFTLVSRPQPTNA